MKSYVLFGAGANAANAVRIIGKDKVAFIVDNDKSKMGTDISEIPVYYFPEKEKDCASYQIVITTSEKFSTKSLFTIFPSSVGTSCFCSFCI